MAVFLFRRRFERSPMAGSTGPSMLCAKRSARFSTARTTPRDGLASAQYHRRGGGGRQSGTTGFARAAYA